MLTDPINTYAFPRDVEQLALTRDNVHGLMWYSFRDPDWYLPESNSEVWRACAQVNEELKELELALVEPVLWMKETEGVPRDGGAVGAAPRVHMA